ncbi:hypothetical protein KI387_017311, partial [Taxus chinensis]
GPTLRLWAALLGCGGGTVGCLTVKAAVNLKDIPERFLSIKIWVYDQLGQVIDLASFIE